MKRDGRNFFLAVTDRFEIVIKRAHRVLNNSKTLICRHIARARSPAVREILYLQRRNARAFPLCEATSPTKFSRNTEESYVNTIPSHQRHTILQETRIELINSDLDMARFYKRDAYLKVLLKFNLRKPVGSIGRRVILLRRNSFPYLEFIALITHKSEIYRFALLERAAVNTFCACLKLGTSAELDLFSLSNIFGAAGDKCESLLRNDRAVKLYRKSFRARERGINLWRFSAADRRRSRDGFRVTIAIRLRAVLRDRLLQHMSRLAWRDLAWNFHTDVGEKCTGTSSRGWKRALDKFIPRRATRRDAAHRGAYGRALVSLELFIGNLRCAFRAKCFCAYFRETPG